MRLEQHAWKPVDLGTFAATHGPWSFLWMHGGGYAHSVLLIRLHGVLVAAYRAGEPS